MMYVDLNPQDESLLPMIRIKSKASGKAIYSKNYLKYDIQILQKLLEEQKMKGSFNKVITTPNSQFSRFLFLYYYL
jgi:hypothetical protein